MRRILWIVNFFIVVAVAGAAVRVHATSVVRFAFDTLCVQAETIAHVRCEAVESFRQGERGDIFTRTRLKILAPIKGNPGSTLVLTLPGGSIAGQRLAVSGIPRFVPGEETVIFLSQPGAQGSPWPMGLRQGCYRVRLTRGGERNIVLRPGVTPLPKGRLYKPTSNQAFSVPLSRFLVEVQQTLASQPAGR